MSDDGFLHLSAASPPTESVSDYWKVIVVDDDKFIHQVTQLVLKNLVIEGKGIRLFNAYTAEQAKQIFNQYKDIALAFIDVVMETDEAGLDLIKWIREQNNNHSTRIILRTGQASHIPEEYIIKTFDINDYKDKTELTANKLTATTYTAIRSYRDIVRIETHLTKLIQLVQSASAFYSTKSVEAFANQSLSQLVELLNIDAGALQVIKFSPSVISSTQKYSLLGQVGEFAEVDHLTQTPPDIYALLNLAFNQQRSLTHNQYRLFFNAVSEHTHSILLLKRPAKLNQFQISCLNIYANSIAINFEHSSFQSQIESAQAELIYALSNSIEAKADHTSYHGQKVALISKKIAELIGSNAKFCSAIGYAAPLHDIGKVIIPEHILNKPGTLSEAEWTIIRAHSETGAKLLSQSNHPITQTASKIALYHHENWDGSGYPKGLKTQSIPLEARIVSLADVLSVLAEKTCYRDAWTLDEIKTYIKAESGRKFEPRLVQVVIEHFADFKAILTLEP